MADHPQTARPPRSGNDPESLHDAIDGRIWFFPEPPNGWTSEAAPTEQWYAINLGRAVRLSRTELAFADGVGVSAPLTYRLQAWSAQGWVDLSADAALPLANGITLAHWPATTTRKVRVLLRQMPRKASRLVEFKLF